MTPTGWLLRSRADVPPDLEWLGGRERAILEGLRIAPRRADWQLGRWAAKGAVGAWLGVRDPRRIEILPAGDGAPEAWLDGRRAPVSVSLSHRGGRALAAVADAPAVVGCDLEVVEPRSSAFVRCWLAAAEQDLVAAAAPQERAVMANLIWTAKEAAAKVRREGLRIDARDLVATPAAPAADGAWAGVEVACAGAPITSGWWRAIGGCVMVTAALPAPAAPTALMTEEASP